MNLDTFINIDKDLATSKLKNLDDIIDVTATGKTGEEEEDDEPEPLAPPPFSKAADCMHHRWTNGPSQARFTIT